MNEPFMKYLWRIAGVHLALVMALFVSSWFRGCRKSSQEDVIYVDLVASLPAAPVETLTIDRDPEPIQEQEPPPPVEERPPPPPPVEERAPPPEETRPRREPIVVSRERVRRGTDEPQQTLSAEEIRREMERATRNIRSEVTSVAIPRSYHDHVGQVMHSAWRQPRGLSLPADAMTTVVIRVNRDGTIVSRRQTRSSGNSVMDSSVMAAVESVARLQPLPSSFSGNHADITINFGLD